MPKLKARLGTKDPEGKIRFEVSLILHSWVSLRLSNCLVGKVRNRMELLDCKSGNLCTTCPIIYPKMVKNMEQLKKSRRSLHIKIFGHTNYVRMGIEASSNVTGSWAQ